MLPRMPPQELRRRLWVNDMTDSNRVLLWGWFAALVIALLVFFLAVSVSHASGYTCAQVRAWYQTYGAEKLLRLAALYGVTEAQKKAAIRCIQTAAK